MTDGRQDDPTGPLGERASARSLPARLRTVVSGRHLGADETSLLQAYGAFDVTFGLVRTTPHTLRRRDGIRS